MNEERVYKRDFEGRPQSDIFNDTHSKQCNGRWLIIDGFGYKMHQCEAIIRRGDTYYYKSGCECVGLNEVYCSALCCYPYKCNNCKRRSCKKCYIANSNDRCSYCVYLSDDCDCPAFDEEGHSILTHDKEWCNL